jgi:hypothetical protein
MHPSGARIGTCLDSIPNIRFRLNRYLSGKMTRSIFGIKIYMVLNTVYSTGQNKYVSKNPRWPQLQIPCETEIEWFMNVERMNVRLLLRWFSSISQEKVRWTMRNETDEDHRPSAGVIKKATRDIRKDSVELSRSTKRYFLSSWVTAELPKEFSVILREIVDGEM